MKIISIIALVFLTTISNAWAENSPLPSSTPSEKTSKNSVMFSIDAQFELYGKNQGDIQIKTCKTKRPVSLSGSVTVCDRIRKTITNGVEENIHNKLIIELKSINNNIVSSVIKFIHNINGVEQVAVATVNLPLGKEEVHSFYPAKNDTKFKYLKGYKILITTTLAN